MEEDETVEGPGEVQKVEKPPGSMTNVSHPVTIYLFGRTGRQKEEWFHRLFSVSIHKEEDLFESIFGGKVAIIYDEVNIRTKNNNNKKHNLTICKKFFLHICMIFDLCNVFDQAFNIIY